MPIFRSLTTRLKTSLSASSTPDSTPEGSPVSPSSFERVTGRKESSSSSSSSSSGTGSRSSVSAASSALRSASVSSASAARPAGQDRLDSFMTQASHGSNVSFDDKKQRRTSRFREELDFEADE
ncbi:hypothetical protein ACJQWK_02658 [Exserohilum turcicum]|uniref:Uncharacterized protein n=1 Tax=Exserohilum turcicum (strain 28A) TaxID=671987 RepID=R0KL64_EXST2|nr:uncharacterized protein SETTUDRAFT_37543 [Exserohilum turcica Et28A]EOA89899.1 hypothetical protein SETTUDRAFT_37543 [Exserohilum turcica Et28A]